MDSERRSLYNSLRMSWLLDPGMSVEPWQVEDYRLIPLPSIFAKLKLQDIELTRPQLVALSDEFESPEELLDYLIKDLEVDEKSKDQIYLLIFELWRRLLPEKPTLTIFCDELDYQIHHYDCGNLYNYEALQDTLENLRSILEENVDLGIDPYEAFELVCSKCANNIEGFLYDFIAERIDENNNLYAKELIEEFEGYLKDSKWFDFLKVRLIYSSDPEGASEILASLYKKINTNADVELNLEILSFLAQQRDSVTFLQFLKPTVPLIKLEEDFKELLTVCSDFYQTFQKEHPVKKITDILKKRAKINLQKPVNFKDPDLTEFCSLVNGSIP